jgi:serine protease Do
MRLFTWPIVGLLSLSLSCFAGDARVWAEDSFVGMDVFRDGAYLGVTLGEVGREDLGRLKLDKERGAAVREVWPDSPAEKAGLQRDDVVLEYGGETVRGAKQLVRLVRETPPGRVVSLQVSRDGAIRKIDVAISERDKPQMRVWASPPDMDVDVAPPEWLPTIPDCLRKHAVPWFERLRAPRKLGIEYQEISGQLASYFKVEERGILIVSVDEDSPAEKAGLHVGDVLLAIDGKRVSTSSDLREAVDGIEPGSDVSLAVQREGRRLEVTLKAAGEKKPEEKRSSGRAI